MSAARKALARIILVAGFILGAAAAGFWFYLMWQAAAAEPSARTATGALSLGAVGGLVVLAGVVWAFARVAERIDPMVGTYRKSNPL